MESEMCQFWRDKFSSMPRSALTVFQLMTLKDWGKVVRSVSHTDPVAGVFLFIITVLLAYGLSNVFLGIMVDKVLKIARNNDQHASRKGFTEDSQTIETLGTFLEATLELEGRTTLRKRDIRDAMFTRSVNDAMDNLALPLAVPDELWTHLDFQNRRTGEMSIEEFTTGITSLVKPSTPTDVCALTARLGGSVTYMSRMGRRSMMLRSDLKDLRKLLSGSYDSLAKLADPASKEQMAEIGLRLQGIISNREPPPPPRYTG